jgi:hypothetical protein
MKVITDGEEIIGAIFLIIFGLSHTFVPPFILITSSVFH